MSYNNFVPGNVFVIHRGCHKGGLAASSGELQRCHADPTALFVSTFTCAPWKNRSLIRSTTRYFSVLINMKIESSYRSIGHGCATWGLYCDTRKRINLKKNLRIEKQQAWCDCFALYNMRYEINQCSTCIGYFTIDCKSKLAQFGFYALVRFISM